MRSVSATKPNAAKKSAVAAGSVDAWSQWGGPSRDFTVDGEGAAVAWSGGVPKILWKRPLGPGYSAIVGDGERLYTMTRRGGEEMILALAPDTGETAWESSYAAPVAGGPALDTTWGEGPNGTPLLVDGRLYALGLLLGVAAPAALVML